MRLDQKITKLGLTPTRSRAQDLIKRGKVLVNGKIVTKPAFQTNENDKIELTENQLFVSRAAEKLLKALKTFDIQPQNKICLDIGSSTGGFTQVLLQNGAKKVYAVDVGTGQMHPSLRNHEKLVLLENTDARQLTKELVPEPVDLFVSDVSFISITKILPSITKLLKPDAQGIILIKPQFELTKELVGKGVVHSPALHFEAIKKVTETLAKNKFFTQQLTYSPLIGGSGNLEFLAYIIYNNGVQKINDNVISQVVQQAHSQLKN